MKETFPRAASVVACVALTFGPVPCRAQSAAPSINYMSFDATFGTPVRIGWYGVTHKDCTLAPLPRIDVVEAPRAGSLTVRPGQLQTAASAPCPNMRIPAEILFYAVRQGGAGDDHLIYRVITTDKADTYDVAIHIKEAQKLPQPNSGKPI